MTETAIRVQRLGKQYRIGTLKRGNETVRDALANAATAARHKFDRTAKQPGTWFWALKDIDFSVSQGEVVGIIGRNGSGKSTLLKILSDVVEPTEGKAEIRGRVSSLLEVGTGFHGELTGRENIYLNGAILGMHQHEVRRKFDEIVEFSGIGQFLDTPVKRYSSGMYVRLAFSVAAHLDPEVLIVDEVLAVGDFKFQQRCLNRMKEAAREGHTVLFVSHSVSSVEMLCSRCILLESGRLIDDGEPYQVTREYRRKMTQADGESTANLDKIEGVGRKLRILRSVRLLDEEGMPTSFIPLSRSFDLRIGVRIESTLDTPVIAARIDNMYGSLVLLVMSPERGAERFSRSGEHEITCRVNEFPLVPGTYSIGLAVWSGGEQIDVVRDVLSFSVMDTEQFEEGRVSKGGLCIARSEWDIGPPLPQADTSCSASIASVESDAHVALAISTGVEEHSS